MRDAPLAFDAGDSVATVLLRSTGADRRFVLRLGDGPPDGLLADVSRLLPAVAERANRSSGPVHIADYWARSAARQR
jgi:hypothetical protein